MQPRDETPKPTVEELREQIKALTGASNVIPIRARAPRGVSLEAALTMAEFNRKMLLEAAANFVEILRDTIQANPKTATPDRVAALLEQIAASIRQLKDEGTTPGMPGPDVGGAA
jgi:hypothetical protein